MKFQEMPGKDSSSVKYLESPVGIDLCLKPPTCHDGSLFHVSTRPFPSCPPDLFHVVHQTCSMIPPDLFHDSTRPVPCRSTDGQFPVELSVVERDHDFLDADSLKSLFRRLETLNKYAGMKIHSQHKKKGTSEEEEDEEDLCALSERWEYQKSARRWSRKEPQSPSEGVSKPLDTRASSHDSLLADQDSGSQTGDSPLMDSKLPHPQDTALPSSGQAAPYSDEPDAVQRAMQKAEVEAHLSMPSSFSPPLRRSASEKVKPTRALWKTMKSKKKAGGGRGIVEISNPVVADKENMQAKLVKFNCRDISPTSNVATTLPHPRNGSERLSVGSPTSPQSAPAITTYTSSFDSPFGSRKSFASQSLRVHSFYADQTDSGNASRDSQLHGFYSAHSKLLQSLESAQQKETGVVKQNKSDNNLKEIFILPEGHQPGRFPTVLQNGYIETKQSAAPGTNEHPSDIPSLSSDVAESYPGVTHEPGHRFSFYDNWLPADGKSDHSGHQTNIPSVPSGSSHLTTGSSHEGHGSNHAVTFDCHKLDSIRESRSSSVLSTSGSQSDSDSRHFLDRHLDQTPYAGGLSSQFRVDKTSRESSAEPSSGGITQSPSLHSGELTESSSLHSSRKTSNAEVVDGASSRSDLKLEYEEFDQILQQLYEKINDLNNYVTKEEKGIPPSQHTRQTPQRSLSVDMTRSQPLPFELDSPVSPNSDSALSPSSPMSTGGIMGGPAEESVEDNSSSGSSGGDSSHSGSDQEVGLTDLSHDDSLDQITHACMERRDSGVGHSLTRASGDRRRKKLRWNSFQKCHRPDVTCRAMQINSLTVSQLVRLQKLSLLKLTSIMEKYLPVNKSGWNWMMAKLMKKKPPDFSGKNVFGVPFTVMAQRTGQPLPQCVLYAMRYLRRTSQNAVGIFRKSGVKSKIQQLRDHLEAHPEISDFEDANAYNVADMLKTYFRDLPECLLTNKMSETFRSIYTYVPQPQRLEAIQAAILLLPDENREVLQSILLFLSDISSHESDHQMNASNLAVCFTPTVFQLGPRYTGSPKRNRKNSPGIPDPREILEQKAAHECLLMMITECKKLFTIPANIFRQLQGTSLAHLEPAPLQDIGNSPADVKAFGQERIQMVLKEAHDKNRGWIPGMVINDVEVFYRKPMDDCPLKEWKLVVDIEAPPIEVLRRIMHERHTWDEDLLSWSVLERLDPHSDIFQYVLSSMAPHPSRHYCVLRYWRSDLNKGACALVTMSVEHSENMDIQGVWAIDLGSFILMEPCGSGRSRVTYITRVDTRGRSPEWYSKVFGHICANFLERLQESFKQESCGPETKV
nr:rho GTPase-activating protein 7 [Biomphalaria glabrata]